VASNRAVNVVIKGDYDNSDVQRAIRELQKLGGTVDNQHSKLAAFGKGAAIAAAAGLAAAAAATFEFAKSSVSAAQESQVADARLRQVATSMGLVNGQYEGGIQRLNEYSTALEKQIGVDDESIKGVQAKLLTFKALGTTINETGGALDRATKAAYDLASAGFGSAEQNATQLGKALQDPVKGLTSLARSGVTFTEGEKEKIKALVASGQAAEAQDLVLKAIEKQVGNTAAATATGAQKMKVSFGELQESVGGALLPVLNTFATSLIPIFDGLQGPLTQVAKAVADNLGKALQALMPILPTLANSLGQIAGVLGQALVTAIQALTPIIQPLLGIMAELGTRIGPLLTPILQKIGELLGKLLAAVMPLLQPLIDLVFTILDAAMPILTMVADLIGILVDALAPLLGVVGQLLAPIGELINVVFKAFEPVLRPLLPVIAALANILGDVLARAIGAIILSAGTMLTAWAKVAPFIFDYVIKPVTEMFLTFASNVLESATSAFSWIPGLGDKLTTARDAVNNFKTNAVKSLGDAATQISTQGEAIGKGLIDSGINLLKDPTQATKLKNAGVGLGGAMADGMRIGIQNGQIPVQAAATDLTNSAEAAARRAADSHSPSMKWYEIGKDLAAGMKNGLMVSWPELAQQIAKDMDGLNLQMTGAATKLGKGMAEGFDKAVQGFQDSIKAQVDLAKQAVDSLTSYSKGIVSNVLGSLFQINTQDDKGNALTPDQIFTNILGGVDSWQAAASKAIPLLTQLPAQLAEQLYQLPPDQIQKIADYFSAHPEMLARLQQRYTELSEWTKTNLGDPMAVAFAKVGDDNASEMLASAQQRIAASASAFKDYVTRKLSTTVHVSVVYDYPANAPGPQPRAIGGPVSSGTPYLVGERGPELFIPDVSGTIMPNNTLSGGGAGVAGNTYNISVQAGVGDPRMIGQQVVEYIKRFEASSGPVFAAA
jgi:phage-related protein